MKKIYIVPLLSLALLVSCGDDSPFDEDYWDTPEADQTEETTPVAESFSANLTSMSENIGNISGTIEINVNGTDSISTTQLSDVPQSLMIGQRSISTLTCAEISASFPPPPIVNDTLEFKSVNTVDMASREALIAELNQADPANGDAANLAGKSYIIKAYVQNLNTPIPQAATLIPIACGSLQAQTTDGSTGGTGGTAGGTTGGTVGTTIGGTVGTTAGGTTGGVDGTVGGTVGTIGGVDGTDGGTPGSVAGGIEGSVGGSIGGTAGTTAGGTVGGTIGGTVINF